MGYCVSHEVLGKDVAKPCPFCGCQPSLTDYGDGDYGINCTNGWCFLGPQIKAMRGKELVLRRWNCRGWDEYIGEQMEERGFEPKVELVHD